jgi:hypothetical protein
VEKRKRRFVFPETIGAVSGSRLLGEEVRIISKNEAKTLKGRKKTMILAFTIGSSSSSSSSSSSRFLLPPTHVSIWVS